MSIYMQIRSYASDVCIICPRCFLDAKRFNPPLRWIFTTNPELQYIVDLYHNERAGVDIRWFAADGVDTRWIPGIFSCGYVCICKCIHIDTDAFIMYINM